MEEARALHYELRKINDALFMETNPIPVKTALWLMEKISPDLRPPLSPLSDKNLQELKSILGEYCLLH